MYESRGKLDSQIVSAKKRKLQLYAIFKERRDREYIHVVVRDRLFYIEWTIKISRKLFEKKVVQVKKRDKTQSSLAVSSDIWFVRDFSSPIRFIQRWLKNASVREVVKICFIIFSIDISTHDNERKFYKVKKPLS
jgi:hypothetical protein